ncbi:response regulator [Sinorhizobium medicae]|uniref:hybrid sensor histidine kinase/response regulator n=1 Tax=Sinorhizobium medicae TaxID=110321 RepID=UPI000FD75C9C|nr:response regulator [Sinorhizobium medicae]MBO1945276.1 response regulator [Sinorhizobium medicae]MDX0485539.1 response regulator [Sinorhizobium medicae]MDX0499658.1 response regulator [Sinorhizobium medicae]MDX0509096.1 response regulator [Sinorhizobium medicae]MDX0528436.1 response regulator [Sinorhizobium medicae]
MITPEELDPGLLSMFTQEVRERASEMETAVLAIEETGDADRKRHLQEQLLRVAHSLKGAAGLLQVRGVEAICHWMEEILSIAAKGRFVLAKPRLDLLLSAADAIRHAADLLESGAVPSSNHGEEVVEKLKSVVAAGVDDNMQKPQQHSSPADPEIAIRVTDTDGSMRVSAARLDALLYRSGELLSFNAIMRRHAEQASSLRDAARKLRGSGPDAAAQAAIVESGLRQLAALLRQDVRRMQSAAAALDEEVRYARTQPFDEACKGLGRIVRDVAAASGKRAELEIRGGEIEVDRSILSALQDSLRHLVRNAVAHGIQTPEERRAAGRPEEGRIRVSAAMRGNRIEIRVEDDGRGLNLALLGAAAGGKTESTQGETELLRRVFEPGVSTSATVTSLSGRGIGLDIVKSNVEKLRGAVDVSQVPTGGAAFTLTLPLTLATLRVLEVIAGGHVFTIDAASVERVIRVNRQDIALLDGRHSVSTSTGPIPVLDLSFWLRLQSNRGDPRRTVPAVVVASSSGPTAVLVDEIAGEQELLLRSLGPRLANVRRYSGGMVLPDGRIALLLNVAALAEAAAKPQPRDDIAGRSAKAARRKVLVVDDSKYVRTLVKLILEGAGYEVTMASDGTEALEQLRECGADVVVADVDMPSMDGFELTRAIRQSDHLTRTPVVLVTGRESVEDKVKGLRAGANAYLRKDQFDAHHFLETMRQVV